MVIRNAIDHDIPQIVELLKMSLGESLVPKSEAYWRWKHIDNPFGRSPVLVAEDAGKLVGVRAFMRWEWTDGNQIYKSVRAVDTATHPAYQGKGIFKKLTLQLIEACQKEDVQFIFNTPNSQSRPGYLKMGWEVAGKLPIRIFFANPILGMFNRNSAELKNSNEMEALFGNLAMNNLLKADQIITQKQMVTNYSPTYLIWRYCKVPVNDYHYIHLDMGNNHEMLIYRLKKSKLATEFRVTDFYGNCNDISSLMLKKLRRTANRVGATYLTFTGSKDRIQAGLNIERGPIVTIRDLQFQNFLDLHDFQYWKPSLGDLELF